MVSTVFSVFSLQKSSTTLFSSASEVVCNSLFRGMGLTDYWSRSTELYSVNVA